MENGGILTVLNSLEPLIIINLRAKESGNSAMATSLKDITPKLKELKMWKMISNLLGRQLQILLDQLLLNDKIIHNFLISLDYFYFLTK